MKKFIKNFLKWVKSNMWVILIFSIFMAMYALIISWALNHPNHSRPVDKIPQSDTIQIIEESSNTAVVADKGTDVEYIVVLKKAPDGKYYAAMTPRLDRDNSVLTKKFDEKK